MPRPGLVLLVLLVMLLIGWQLLRPSGPPGEGEVGLEFVRGNNTDPESLDPLHARSEPALNILRDLHEGLTTLDAAGHVVPGAAARWEVSEDGREWHFDLDPAARWSDGAVVTAGQFATALEMLIDPTVGSPHAGLFGAIEQFAAESDDRLRLVLSRPVPWLAELLAHPAAAPRRSDVPPDGRIASGAFRLEEQRPGSHLLLARNPHYRAAASVAIERVRYLPIADHASELSRYRAGELHMTYTAPVSRVPWLTEHKADQFRVSPYLAVYFYGFNTRRPPLDDVRVRRALLLSVDRELIASRVVGAGEQPACALVPAGLPDYRGAHDAECTARRRERIERAQELLTAAGYGPERPLTLEIRYNTGELHERIAVAVSALWKEALGVETRLVREEFRVLLANVRAGDVTQVYRGSWIADFAEPDSFLGILASDNPVNGTGWAEERYDRLLEQAAATRDRARRYELLAAAEAMALEAAPLMPLYFYVSKKLVKPDVRGIEENPLNIHPSRFVRLCAPAGSAC